MSGRWTRVAWTLLAAFATSVAAGLLLAGANSSFEHEESLTDTVALLLAFTAFLGVGALIVAHRPGNAVGWIFAAIAMLAVTGATAEEYALDASATRPGALPARSSPAGTPPGPGTRPSPWRWCSRPCSFPTAGCRRRAGGPVPLVGRGDGGHRQRPQRRPADGRPGRRPPRR